MTIVKGLLVPGFFIASWVIASYFHLSNAYLLPSPESVVHTALVLSYKGILVRHILTSLCRVLVGFSLSFLVAFPAAMLLGMNRRLMPYIDPMLHFIRHIPPIACIPLLILWLGIGEVSKIAVIILAAFFPIFLNALAGIVQCDAQLIEVGQVFGLTGREKLLNIILPAALPAILLGMRLGLGYSWRALIGAELIAASAGIGYMIIEAEQLSRSDIVIVGILAIGCFGYIMDAIFLKLSALILPWQGEAVKYDSFSSKGAL